MRFVVCRLPSSFEQPLYFLLDRTTFNVVRELEPPHKPLRFDSFVVALGRARKLNERVEG